MLTETLPMRRLLPKTFSQHPFLILAVIVGVTGLGCSRKESVPTGPLGVATSLQTAQKALEANQPDRALQLLAPALQSNPQDPEILNLQGAILTKKKEYPAARSCYEAALRKSPQFFPALYNIGALLALEGKWEEATTYFRNFLIDQPNNELLQYKLLLLLLVHDGDPALQAKLFSSTVPSNTPGWYYASAARAYKEGRPGEAKRLIEVAGSIYGDKTSIFTEELEESGLAHGKHGTAP